ncbi:RicAFT regulatory complex protein RicA family protein [Paenibacillus sp.]|uniref:RicAFT regulatory complex protein RicA family protein n=1 Tax=Paenibacillus sp. TaxID=58172 RepID=UPI002D676B7F|nr:YlbF family regulator [Paenibacillus sp.]HZG57363.1 YlbF family regulator [Paenibacillus sp.]
MAYRQQRFRDDGHACAPGEGRPKVSYDTKDLLIREDIMAKAKEVAELLSTSEEADVYRKAEKRVNEHEDIQKLIAAIKKKQKEIVAFETTFKNADMVKKIEAEIDELQNKLDEYPIVTQFRQSQQDLNYTLQLVFNIIRDTLSEKIAVEDAATTAASAGGGDCG